MSQPIWKPNATVAAVITHEDRYLLVEEDTDDGVRFNQPAGHLDHGESLCAAVSRETLEETAYGFVPEALVGIYLWSPPDKGDLSYLRFAFAGRLNGEGPPPGTTVHAGEWPLDQGIRRAVWLSYPEVLACRDRHRSPLILQCIDDYRVGRRFPLELLWHAG